MSKQTKVSIIIRTKDEEDWLKPCLQAIQAQEFEDTFEIILVDNQSTDGTLKVAKEFHVNKILKIKEFLPGKAINRGIKASKGEKVIIISAHCIPNGKDWLESLTKSLNNKNIAGVYGKQIPLPFTSPDDSRDLLMTFGLETRLQKKDFMFHNAHSIIWRDVWEKIPFDEKTKNIEDRIWGKEVIESGFQLKYDPKPQVFHHHGLHQHGNRISFRADNISKVIRSMEGLEQQNLPNFMRPIDKEVPILIPLNKKIRDTKPLLSYINSIIKNNNEKVFVYSSYEIPNIPKGVTFIKRRTKSSDEILFMLQDALSLIEKNLKRTVDGISVCDFRYKHPIFEAPKKCKELMFNMNHKYVSYAYPDQGVHWLFDGNSLKPLNELSKIKPDQIIYRLSFGQGTTIRASKIRQGNLMSSESSIIKLDDLKYLLRN